MKILSHCSIVAILSLCALAGLGWLTPSVPCLQAAEGPVSAGPPPESAISAVFAANGGKAPATGEQLWRALCKVGAFSQLPIPFSSVRLDSGIYAPRVVIAPRVAEVSLADVTTANVVGRLYFAANMERAAPGGDARVTSVEFISWNTSRRRFDFGMIESMGSGEEPQFRIVDGGKCFSCHKNRGPILGIHPWSNTTHDDVLRFAVASALRMNGMALPQTGPFVLPQGAALRDRVDGMALALPEASEVDPSIRLGALLESRRNSIRLLAHSAEGRKVLVMLLVNLTEKAQLSSADRSFNNKIDDAFYSSLNRFATEWVDLHKAAKSSILADIDPKALLVASGVRPPVAPGGRAWGGGGTGALPGIVGGNSSLWRPPVSAPAFSLVAGDSNLAQERKKAAEQAAAITDFRATLVELARYETARTAGFHGLTTRVQPSNPRAFVPFRVTRPTRVSEVVNPVLLANTIGLTDGDRRFLTRSLESSAKKVGKSSVTPATLAKQVFEGPQFATFLNGAPLPDRDEFKDRFVAGLDEVLKAKHNQRIGFDPDRRDYASGPKYDPDAVEKPELVAVPTTACLRCHEVGRPAKGAQLDLIPALVFDPFDIQGRAAWLKTVNPKDKRQLLSRLLLRLATDADMPPEDSPEHNFRLKDAAAFAEAKQFLQTELDKVK